MAKYLPTKWSDARGRENGLIWSRNQYGLYFKNFSAPVQPNTPKQLAERSEFAAIVSSWKLLTEDQRIQWNEAAINFIKTNIFGNQFKYTGYNLYIHINRWRQEIGAPITPTPPPPAAPPLVLFEQLTASSSPESVIISFTPNIPAGSNVIMYMTPPLSAGKNFVRKEYRKLTTAAGPINSPVNITNLYTSQFGSIAAHAGKKIFFKGKMLTQEGIPGPNTSTFAIIT
jgi:hypothetical protein